MTLHLPLHLEARRRKEEPSFAAASRAIAETVNRRALGPLVAARLDVEDVLFAARIHGVSGLLASLLDSEREEGPLVRGLRQDREALRARGERLRADLFELGRSGARVGLPFVPLKGTYLFAARYEEPAHRPMADLDLLALPGSFEAWTRVLADLGYDLVTKGFKDWVFERPGSRTPTDFAEHQDNPRPVELHFGLPVRLLGRTADVTSRYRSGLGETTLLGVPALVPGDDLLALHLLVHAGPALVGRGARLIQLVDFSKLRVTREAPALFRDVLGREVAWGLTRLLDRPFPGALPPELLSDLSEGEPPASRRRLWESRPGLLTGEEERRTLVLAELPLCDSIASRLGRVKDSLPEGSFLTRAYGRRGLASFVRYYRDRVAR